MSKGKGKGRPGGNPDLVKYQFKTDRKEPCNALLTVKVPASQLEALKLLPNWQEKIRESLSEIVSAGKAGDNPALFYQSAVAAGAAKLTASWRAGAAETNQPSPVEISPQPTGAETRAGRKTKQGSPSPKANAREAQDPDPKPEKHRELDREGIRPIGQGEEGKETQQPPAAATA
jgi:hypothetical protein